MALRVSRPLAATSAAVAFVPTGAAIWLKADSLNLSNGAAVATWADQTANGKDAANATGAEQPFFVTNQQNGKPCVRFDGSNDSLVTPSIDLSLTDKVTLAFVGSSQSNLGEVAAIHFGTGSTSGGGFAAWPNGTTLEMLNDGSGSWFNITGETLGVGRTHVVTYDKALASSEMVLRTNGASSPGSYSANGNTTGNYTSAALFLGRRGSGSLFSNYNLNEMLIWPRQLTADEIAWLENYLRARWATW